MKNCGPSFSIPSRLFLDHNHITIVLFVACITLAANNDPPRTPAFSLYLNDIDPASSGRPDFLGEDDRLDASRDPLVLRAPRQVLDINLSVQ